MRAANFEPGQGDSSSHGNGAGNHDSELHQGNSSGHGDLADNYLVAPTTSQDSNLSHPGASPKTFQDSGTPETELSNKRERVPEGVLYRKMADLLENTLAYHAEEDCWYLPKDRIWFKQSDVDVRQLMSKIHVRVARTPPSHTKIVSAMRTLEIYLKWEPESNPLD
jgi:hypothetical protein